MSSITDLRNTETGRAYINTATFHREAGVTDTLLRGGEDDIMKQVCLRLAYTFSELVEAHQAFGRANTKEEYAEFEEQFKQQIENAIAGRDAVDCDVVDRTDKLATNLVKMMVSLGTVAEKFSSEVNMAEIFNNIHRANMSKRCPDTNQFIVNTDGKICKGRNFIDPAEDNQRTLEPVANKHQVACDMLKSLHAAVVKMFSDFIADYPEYKETFYSLLHKDVKLNRDIFDDDNGLSILKDVVDAVCDSSIYTIDLVGRYSYNLLL